MAFGFSPPLPCEAVEDAALDFDSLTIDDEPRETDFKMTGEKRKDRSGHEEKTYQRSRSVGRGSVLEEASAPDEERLVKRRPSTRVQ